MLNNNCNRFVEKCGCYTLYYLLIVFSVFVTISPANLVAASYEFTAFRMAQYDLHGIPHGCRSAPISLEAQSLSGWNTSRHCVMVRAEDFTKAAFQTIRQKAGALVVILPKNINNLSKNDKQHLMTLEESMINGSEITIPVYFINWNKNLQAILEDIENSLIMLKKTRSATETLLSSISASSYHVIVSSNQAIPKIDLKISTIHGKLPGTGVEEKLPTIALVAHYDSKGVAPELSFGAESNASGLAMLLELMRVFSQYYSDVKSRPHYNLVFIITGAGKLNYQGSKKWLEDQLEGLENSIIQDLSYVICLDSVSSSNTLYSHVSKPPKETSLGGVIYKELKAAAVSQGFTNVEGIHKKINLAEESLAWEHERFSIRRLPAVTLSSLKNFDDPLRNTILDTLVEDQIETLYKHTNVIAEALFRCIYNISSSHIFSQQSVTSKDFLSMWMKFLTSQPRAANLLAEKQNHLVDTLKDTMQQFFRDVKVTLHSSEKRDPDFVFYDVTTTTLNVYRVKPAIFDLLLTSAIVAYLATLSLVVHTFPYVYNFVRKISCKPKAS